LAELSPTSEFRSIMKGRCLICDSLGKLSRDHVPPRSVVPLKRVEVQRVIALWGGQPNQKPRKAFQSIEFPSLCQICNSDRLGSTYDPYLAEFAKAVTTWVRSAFQLYLTLPGSFSIAIKPHRVARAVIGHLLAAEERKDPTAPLRNGPMPDDMRRYFLNVDEPAPAALELYVWPYASETQRIVRAFSVAELGSNDSVLGSVLKFFPLAFWLVYERPETTHIRLPSLPLHLAGGLDLETTITLPLKGIPRPDFPEAPGPSGIVMMNNESTFTATPPRR